MLIKRKQNQGLIEKTSEHNALEHASYEAENQPAPDWSAEHIDSGLVPERRLEKSTSERRRGYRRDEDRDLISKAHEEATAIKEHAHTLGFQEGLNQAQGTIDELRDFMGTQMALREQALESVAKEIAELAVEVAARIIKTEVSCDETLVMSLVRDTIQKSTQGQRGGKGSKRILIKVNPDDVALVKKELKQQLKEDAGNGDFQGGEIMVMGEPSVDSGSCILETDSGMIDASFTTQLDILYRLFGGASKNQA